MKNLHPYGMLGRIFRRLQRNMLCSPWYFVKNYHRRGQVMYNLHWHCLRLFLTKENWRRLCGRYLLMLLWPILCLVLAIVYVKRFGAAVKGRHGVAWRDLLRESLALALFEHVLPLDYYRNQLYLPENKPHIPDLLFMPEAALLFRSLNSSFHLEAVDDKAVFYRLCQEKHVITPLVYHVIEAGTDSQALPEKDFVLKPAHGCRGEGIELWFYRGQQRYGRTMGENLAGGELFAYIRSQAVRRQDRMLLQRRISNHESLQRFSLGALVTVRVVTVRKLNQAIVPLMSVLVIPTGEKMLHARVLLSPIQEDAGKLGRATAYGITAAEFTHHPDTKKAIEGFTLPYWEEIIRMTTTAHGYFPDYWSLGWDVAITEEGPVILAATQCWDVETMQKPHHRPLGQTIFADILKSYL